ncbi:MAG: sigma-70 family RNA polymerase sigma factor [Chloroflexi bacterium]|nr:sigma-70 family RNA polymerase sigma factor [Chloroflexota bacterium]
MRGPRAGADSRSWDAEFTPSDERTDGMPIARKGADAADLAYLQAIRRIPRLGAVEEADLTAAREAGVEAARHLERLHGVIPEVHRSRAGCAGACRAAAEAVHANEASRRLERLRRTLPTTEVTEIACDAGCLDAFDRVRAAADARLRLIEGGLHYVVPIARAYAGRGMPLVDLVHEGAIGLTRAVDRYDARAGMRLQAYAYWWIRQAVGRAFANYFHLVRLPIHVIERLNVIARVTRTLTQDLRRLPTPDEIAAQVGMTVHQLHELGDLAVPMLSLDHPAPGDDVWDAHHHAPSTIHAPGPWDDDVTHPDDAIDPTIGDTLGDDLPPPDAQAIASLMAREVIELLRVLSPRQAIVVRLRHGFDTPAGEPATLDEVGERVALTRERVRQIEGDAMARLRRTPAIETLHAYLEEG